MSRGGGGGGGVTRGEERVSGYRKEDFDRAFLDIKISTRAISYISMGMPAQEPIINSILGKKSDLQNRNFSHLVWGAWGRQTVHLPLDYMKCFESLTPSTCKSKEKISILFLNKSLTHPKKIL